MGNKHSRNYDWGSPDNSSTGISADVWRQVEKKRLPPPTPHLQPQADLPNHHFLTKAFTRAGYVNWAGFLVKFPWLTDPSSTECALSAKKEEDGWKITRHSRSMNGDAWKEDVVTLPKDIYPGIIKSAVMSWAVRAGEETNVHIRTPDELYKGAEPNISDKGWPYLTPVFKNAGKVTLLRFRGYGISFDYADNTPCALLVRPVLNGNPAPDQPVPKNLHWEVTRYHLSGNVLQPEEPRTFPVGIQQSQVLDAVISWSRAARAHSNGEFSIDNKLKATLLVDTAIDERYATRGRTAKAPNPPSR